MTFKPIVAIKNFFGLYVLTPFEQALLHRLSLSLTPGDREALSCQLARFTTVRRVIKHIDEPKAHGFTNFYTRQFGRNVSTSRQVRRFTRDEGQALLAKARVTFDGGEMNVEFWLVGGVLFSIEYRSQQHIYYPPASYEIDRISVYPEVEKE